jgi:hypothetical protein
VSFGWTDLGEFRRDKIPAHVWLALARRRGGEPEPSLTAGTSFAVKAEIRPPYGQSPRLSAELVKGIIDGVVSAFQAHTDTSTSGQVAARLANVLPAGPAEIEDLLLERRWAVLGLVRRLVYLRDGAVQWNPGDDWCDAGELLAAEPTPADTGWAITGQIIELSRSHNATAASPHALNTRSRRLVPVAGDERAAPLTTFGPLGYDDDDASRHSSAPNEAALRRDPPEILTFMSKMTYG